MAYCPDRSLLLADMITQHKTAYLRLHVYQIIKMRSRRKHHGSPANHLVFVYPGTGFLRTMIVSEQILPAIINGIVPPKDNSKLAHCGNVILIFFEHDFIAYNQLAGLLRLRLVTERARMSSLVGS